MKWLDWIATKTLWVAIGFGLAVGLIGAYGRERHEGRTPGGDWWLNRLLIMPFLAISATAATDALRLSTQLATFIASVLSLLAYDAVRAIRLRALKKIDPGIGEVESPDGGAILTVSSVSGGMDKLEVQAPQSEDRKYATALRRAFKGSRREELPEEFQRLLNKMDDGETRID